MIKLSGETLAGDGSIISAKTIQKYGFILQELIDMGVEVGIVIGGGNFFRGENLSHSGLTRVSGDQMGMLATVMNSLALRDIFENQNLATRIMSSIPIPGIIDCYDIRKAISDMKQGKVVIFASGTGNTLATTDSAASLRSIEIGANILIKATKVNGIYDKDPIKFSDAKFYKEISFQEILNKELEVMDLASFCQCRDHRMPIQVCNINHERALQRIVCGEIVGSLVK